MIGILLRVPEAQLEAFRQDSSLLEDYVDSIDIDDNEKQLDLDKSWDGLNYLLTGHTLETIEEAEPPLSQVIFSGQLVDEDQDMGYGPAHYLDAEQVSRVNEALSRITAPQLREKYNAKELMEKDVYPQVWEDDEEEVEWLVEYFEELKAFYAAAAGARQAMITYIT